LEVLGLRFGSIGLYCLAFLFLPVARGSVLLRLIDIPVEHATRYHVWLGHLTMLLFTLHGLFYVIAWAIEGNLLQEVSAINAVILFLYSYTCVFSLWIYLFVCLFAARSLHHSKSNDPLEWQYIIFISKEKDCRGQ
jgi:hypothetical protein